MQAENSTEANPSPSRQSSFSVEWMRIREIEKIIVHRHAGILPACEDSFRFVRAVLLAKSPIDIQRWCSVWAPWIPGNWDTMLKRYVGQSIGRQHMLCAGSVAKLLEVTFEERTELGLRTIGACDKSKAERREIAKQNKRERERRRYRAKRRAQGCVERKVYEANSIQRIKPWERLEISRSTFYRMPKPERDAIVKAAREHT